jgi:hypothetical protein
MSYAWPAASAERLLAVLALCLALISPPGQRLIAVAATWVGQLYATAVTTAVVHHSPGTTATVTPAKLERSSR